MKLPYKFKNEELLTQALTHSTYSNQNKGEPNNLLMIQLGKHMLVPIIFEHYMHTGGVGQVTEKLHKTNNLVRMAEFSCGLGVHEAMRTGRKITISDMMVVDTLKAIIAAVYLDSDYETAKKFCEEILLTN